MSGAGFNRGASRQDYATPPDFMAAVTKRFGEIDVDLAASRENAKAFRFITEDMDSLQEPWHNHGGLLWLNPPFDDIAPWAAKCASEAELGARILFLTPASVGANWFAQHVHGRAHVIALNGRMSFDGKAPYPKDCILSVFGFGVNGFSVWRWKP